MGWVEVLFTFGSVGPAFFGLPFFPFFAGPEDEDAGGGDAAAAEDLALSAIAVLAVIAVAVIEDLFLTE